MIFTPMTYGHERKEKRKMTKLTIQGPSRYYFYHLSRRKPCPSSGDECAGYGGWWRWSV